MWNLRFIRYIGLLGIIVSAFGLTPSKTVLALSPTDPVETPQRHVVVQPFGTPLAQTAPLTATITVSSTVSPAEITIFDDYATLNTTLDFRSMSQCPAQPGERQPLDIVLVIDHSSSMNDNNNMDAARQAAQGFVKQIDTTQDQIGIVIFNQQATELLPLSQDQTTLINKIGSIQANDGTDISQGLIVGQQTLSSAKANPKARKIIILLSDGGNDQQSLNAPATAHNAKNAGIRVITIGLANSNNSLLQQVASQPSDFYPAPDAAQLTTIYTNIAQNVQAGIVARDVTIKQALPKWSTYDNDRETVWTYPNVGQETLPLTVRFKGRIPHDSIDTNDGITVTYHDCTNTLQTVNLPPSAPIKIKFGFGLWCLLPFLVPLLLSLFFLPLLRKKTHSRIRKEGALIPEVAMIPELAPLIQPQSPSLGALEGGTPPVVSRQPALIIGTGDAGNQVITQIDEVTR